jgi:serine/threonine protein phosphatase 1
LLEQHKFDPQQDLLISVGDIIDRGPDSLGCLALLQEPWFRCVRGNHEEMALSALQGQEMALWQMNGGDWFFRLRGAALIAARHALRRCRELPLILHLQLGERIIVIAHADYPAQEYALNKPLDWQQVVWSRQRLEGIESGEQAGIRGADAFYFGHTPLKQSLTIANLHYIDTGAVFGNHLTLLRLK